MTGALTVKLREVLDAGLETEHLKIRCFDEDDFYPFWQLGRDDETCRMMGWPLMTSPRLAHMFFDVYRQTGWFAIEHLPSSHMIGCLEVTDHSTWFEKEKMDVCHTTALAYVIQKNYRRRGLMKECLEEVVNAVKRTDPEGVILCQVFQENSPSAGLLKKLGFVCVSAQMMGDRQAENYLKFPEKDKYPE